MHFPPRFLLSPVLSFMPFACFPYFHLSACFISFVFVRFPAFTLSSLPLSPTQLPYHYPWHCFHEPARAPEGGAYHFTENLGHANIPYTHRAAEPCSYSCYFGIISLRRVSYSISFISSECFEPLGLRMLWLNGYESVYSQCIGILPVCYPLTNQKNLNHVCFHFYYYFLLLLFVYLSLY